MACFCASHDPTAEAVNTTGEQIAIDLQNGRFGLKAWIPHLLLSILIGAGNECPLLAAESIHSIAEGQWLLSPWTAGIRSIADIR